MASDHFFSSKDQAMPLIPFGKLLSTSRPCPQAEGHLGSESGQPPEVGPASAHRRRPGAARLQRRGPDRRRSERRHGTERRGNIDLAPATWIARLGSSLRGLGSRARFLAGVAVVDDRGDLLGPLRTEGGRMGDPTHQRHGRPGRFDRDHGTTSFTSGRQPSNAPRIWKRSSLTCKDSSMPCRPNLGTFSPS